MKSFVVFALLAAAALAAPPRPEYAGDEKNAEVLKYHNDNIGVEGYKFELETSNGIKQEEEAALKKVGNEGEVVQVIRGSYSYPSPDGPVITVTWTADENGFHPEGSHLPK